MKFSEQALIITIILSIISGCTQRQPSKLEDNSYKEAFRPQFHFSPEANWMNDPNGMVYYNGEYHLFYQHYPDANIWGPMHWGHAVSTNLLDWTHLPIALYPDSLGYIFSGSAVIDYANSSPFGSTDIHPMVAIFTHHNMQGEHGGSSEYQYQSLAYSLDNGRSFVKYEGNPVVTNPGIKDFRDPKVIRDDERGQWVMVLAAYDKTMFYTSEDLISWQLSGEFGIPGDTRLWECPDLIKMKIQGSEQSKWVLISSIQREAPNGGTATGYFVGDFDGKTFIGDPNGLQWLDFGKDNYAFVSWSNVPKEQDRVIGIGWMSNWQYAQVVPTTQWRSAMTLPRELTLAQKNDRISLRSMPVKEVEELIISKHPINTLTKRINIPDLSRIKLLFNAPSKGKVVIKLENELNESIEIGYNHDVQQLFVDRRKSGKVDFQEDFSGVHSAPVQELTDSLAFTIYVDHSSIEVFLNNGQVVMTEIAFPTKPFQFLDIDVSASDALWLDGSVEALRSIWKK